MPIAPYDSFDYPSYWIGRQYEDEAEKIALKKLFSKIHRKDSIVDIGGGFGRHIPFYSPLFHKCLLVDPSKKLLEIAKEQFPQIKNFETKQGQGDSIPTKDEQFDVALLIRVAHHLTTPILTFKEIYRILKPGGFFILEFANKTHFLAKLRAWGGGDFNFTRNLESVDQRSLLSISEGKIAFLNHHPQLIKDQLKEAGFEITDSLSVSNFRSSIIKHLLPLPLLHYLESILQKPFSGFNFGPSIFYLAVKK